MEPLWIEFKYERMPTLCKKCLIIGHDESKCSKSEDKIPAHNGTPAKGIKDGVVEKGKEADDGRKVDHLVTHNTLSSREVEGMTGEGTIGTEPEGDVVDGKAGNRKVTSEGKTKTNDEHNLMLIEYCDSQKCDQLPMYEVPSRTQQTATITTDRITTDGDKIKGKEMLRWIKESGKVNKGWAHGAENIFKPGQPISMGAYCETKEADGKERWISANPKGMKRKKRNEVNGEKIIKLIEAGCLVEVNVTTERGVKEKTSEDKAVRKCDEDMEEVETGDRSRLQQ